MKMVGKNRPQLIDWLIDIHTKLDLKFECLFIAVTIIDRVMNGQQWQWTQA